MLKLYTLGAFKTKIKLPNKLKISFVFGLSELISLWGLAFKIGASQNYAAPEVLGVETSRAASVIADGPQRMKQNITQVNFPPAPDINARAVLVYTPGEDTILYSKNPS